MSRKVVIIGVDGGNFCLLNKYVKQGLLPNFKKIISEGASNILESTIPAATVPAWPTFYTGKNSGKHGVFDFFAVENDKRRLIDNTDVCARPLWEILGLAGKRSIVFNVPTTFPPRISNGILCSGMLSRKGHDYVYPSRYKELFNELTASSFKINEDASIGIENIPKFSNEISEIGANHAKVFNHLLSTEEWDLGTIVFRGTDILQHQLWGVDDVVSKAYIQVDEFLGNILKTYPDSNVVIMSDHGFTKLTKYFHINRWFLDEGYLKLSDKFDQDNETVADEMSMVYGKNNSTLYNNDGICGVFRKLGITRVNIKRYTPDILIKVLLKTLPKLKHLLPFDSMYSIDKAQSIVYGENLMTTETQSVTFNPSFKEKYLNEVVDKLKKLKCPLTGKLIVKEIYMSKDVYHGPYEKKAPEMLLKLNDGIKMKYEVTTKKIVSYAEKNSGCHTSEGIFICYGEGIKKLENSSGTYNILDVTPTVLHMFGIPVDREMDGNVLTEIFEEGSEFNREIEFKDYEKHDHQNEYVNVEVDSDIEERLRNLGYL